MVSIEDWYAAEVLSEGFLRSEVGAFIRDENVWPLFSIIYD